MRNVLESLRNKDVEQKEDFINKTKLLMTGASLEEKEILKSMGLGKNIIESEKATRNINEFKDLEKEFEGEVYTYEQIEYLAFKYNLKFQGSNNFNGGVPNKIGSIILEFKKKHLLSDYDVREGFRILASKKLFNSNKNDANPLIFYKVENKNNSTIVYKVVNKSEDEFNISRIISGFIHKNEHTVAIKFLVLTITSFLTLFYSIQFLAKQWGTILWSTDKLVSNWVFGILIALCWLGLIGCVIGIISLYFEKEFRVYTSKYNWKNNYSKYD